MRRRVTFSRNVTLSLSRTCVSHCKYCAFATHRPHLHAPDEVERLLDHAARRNVKELLVLTGDDPAHHPGVRERLAALGFDDFVAYVVWCCERALERGLLPHTNLGALGRDELARLREVTASQGLMLESLRPDLVAHQASPTKDPALRLRTMRDAEALRIPWTSGILVGIGETEEDRMAALEALAGFSNLQEVILQNFVPHRRYYGEEPAEIATDAAEHYWRTGLHDGPGRARAPAWSSPVTVDDMERLVREARRLMPEVGVQIPPNLADWWPRLVAAGATDLGGLSANGDHISPEHPFPSPSKVRKRLAEDGYALTERLCVYPQYIDQEWMAQGVLDVIKARFWSFIPRRGSGRLDGPKGALRPDSIARARHGGALDAGELTALFAETRPEVIEDMRQAADELRAELAGDTVTFVVNRNINVSNICVVGCAFCGFGQGKRSPDAYTHSEEEMRRRVREAVAFGATEICMQSGIHPDWTFEDYLGALRTLRDEAPHLHLHAYSPMEIDAMAGDRPLPEVFAAPARGRARLAAGTAAEVLDDGVRARISPNKLPVARWVEIVEAAHAAGLRSTVTVMFGHIEEPHELAEHMRVVRALQERSGGFTEFVPLSFIPFQTLLGRTHGIEEISVAENLKHTAAFRLALGRTIPSLQASWVKMGLEAATEALRWGVNDLGGTLMEESISRLAGSYHGVKLDPDDLVGAAHRAGRPAAERTTLYEIRREYPVVAAAA